MTYDISAIVKIISPRAKNSFALGISDSWNQMIEIAQLTTVLRKCHFLAQCAKESDGFITTKEYASGIAYEFRKDLGNDIKGEGIRYKGAGIIQTTGHENFLQISKDLNFDFIKYPEKLQEFPYAALSAAYFWKKRINRLNAAADADDIEKVTRIVNGGLNGLKDRKIYLMRAKIAFEYKEKNDKITNTIRSAFI